MWHAMGDMEHVTSCGRHMTRDKWMHGSYCGARGVASYGGMQDVASMVACWGWVPNSRRGGSCPAAQQQRHEVGSCAIIHTCNLQHGVVCRLGGMRKVMCTALRVHASSHKR